MQDLQWFLDREMSSVLRTEPKEEYSADFKTPTYRTIEVPILNKEVAKYQHSLQKKGFTFAPIVRVHKAAPTGCASCEA